MPYESIIWYIARNVSLIMHRYSLVKEKKKFFIVCNTSFKLSIPKRSYHGKQTKIWESPMVTPHIFFWNLSLQYLKPKTNGCLWPIVAEVSFFQVCGNFTPSF